MVARALVAAAWGLLLSTASASRWMRPRTQVAATCQTLKEQLGSVITLPSDAEYTDLSDQNWSETAWKTPTCIAVPASAADVQAVVKALVPNNVSFAIRSGGHSPNAGDANIDTGVLISMDRLSQVTYDAASGLASIGTGARWDTVYTALDQHNLTVVGGRVMDVGVGGLTLGSGLSYLTDLYGLACDNVVSYEVVLADGRLVEANASSNTELFWGLKGSSNNFGVVTRFKSTTYPIYQVWGGVQLYPIEQMADILKAFNEYQSQPNKDLYANLNLNLAPTNGSAILTLVYLKPVERPEAFAPFYKLKPAQEQLGLMTLHELMDLFSTGSLPRWAWYTTSFKPTAAMFDKVNKLLSPGAPEVAAVQALTAGTLVGTVQPINDNVALAGQQRGGNALGLQAVNQTWFALNVGYWNAADDAAARSAIVSLHAKVEAAAREEGVAVEYRFMNDANAAQHVIASYGDANVRRLRAVQAAYDPRRVFQHLVPGGQKIPAA